MAALSQLSYSPNAVDSRPVYRGKIERVGPVQADILAVSSCLQPQVDLLPAVKPGGRQ